MTTVVYSATAEKPVQLPPLGVGELKRIDFNFFNLLNAQADSFNTTLGSEVIGAKSYGSDVLQVTVSDNLLIMGTDVLTVGGTVPTIPKPAFLNNTTIRVYFFIESPGDLLVKVGARTLGGLAHGRTALGKTFSK